MGSCGLGISFRRTASRLDIYPAPLLTPSLTPRGCFAGHGSCSCGRCVCERGWFGTLCQHPRQCNMTEEQSKSLCESADGILCSGKGECLCRSLDLVPVLTQGLGGSASLCRSENHAVLCFTRLRTPKLTNTKRGVGEGLRRRRNG